jgi:polar amino acid transport system substrate-binding protein
MVKCFAEKRVFCYSIGISLRIELIQCSLLYQDHDIERLSAMPGAQALSMSSRYVSLGVALALSAGIVTAAPADPSPLTHLDDHAARAERKILQGGWYPWDPYQYHEYRHGVQVLTGFDVEIERAVARAMGVDLILTDMAWDRHLAAIAAGTADIAAGATYSPERARYAYFSKPYRHETDVLVVRKGASSRYPFQTVEQMLELFTKQQFRLGVIAGYVYADERVNEFIADPANAGVIVKVGDDLQNLENLLDGSIDGFLADRIAAATAAWRQQKSGLIEEHSFRFSTDIHFLLSRVSQTPAMQARIDSAIDKIKGNGEFQRIANAYALPILIHQTIDSDWFRILVTLGTASFALSGVVLAYAGRSTLFGAVVLASLPAVGGGVVRDLLLHREPVAIVRDPLILLTIFGTVLVGMLVIKIMSLAGAKRFAQSLQSQGHLGTHLIQI